VEKIDTKAPSICEKERLINGLGRTPDGAKKNSIVTENKRISQSMSRGGSGTRGRRRLERQPRGDHSAHVEDGHVESGFSRGSSLKKSVSGLVRRVSQRVTRENKEPLRRRGSRRSRQGSTKKSFKRSRSVKRQAVADYDKDPRYQYPGGLILSKQPSVSTTTSSILHRINMFVTSSFTNFLILIGYQHQPTNLTDILATDNPTGSTEKEEVDIVPKRYRPDNLDALCSATGFSRPQMKRLYRVFKSECPSGLITEEVFHNIFSKFFPLGAESYNANVSSYSHYVFTALASEDCEVITFEDFVVGLSLLINGSQDDKLEWTFHLYDLDGDGFICKEEMLDVAMSIYELMGNSRDFELYKNVANESDISKKVDLAFQKFDIDGDGVVDLEEFLTICHQDAEIQRSLTAVKNIKI